jgi:uncharacterized membrane protein YfcA
MAMQSLPQLLNDLAYCTAIGGALGLTRTGESILAVPALVCLVGLDAHTAIRTSLAVVGGIAAEGVVSQRKTVLWNAGLLLGIGGLVGSTPGALTPFELDDSEWRALSEGAG